MAQKRWICISRTIQWERSNEFAPQRYTVMMPYFLNTEENNQLFWSDLFVVVIYSFSAATPYLTPNFNLGQNRTLIYISPFCVAFPNLTLHLFQPPGVTVSPG